MHSACVYTFTCMYVCVCKYVYVRMCVCVCVCSVLPMCLSVCVSMYATLSSVWAAGDS